MLRAGLEALRELTPRRHRMMSSTAALAFALTATHRVVNGIHDHTADMRTNSEPTATACFASRDVHVVGVSDLADRGVTVFVDAANFAGG